MMQTLDSTGSTKVVWQRESLTGDRLSYLQCIAATFSTQAANLEHRRKIVDALVEAGADPSAFHVVLLEEFRQLKHIPRDQWRPENTIYQHFLYVWNQLQELHDYSLSPNKIRLPGTTSRSSVGSRESFCE